MSFSEFRQEEKQGRVPLLLKQPDDLSYKWHRYSFRTDCVQLNNCRFHRRQAGPGSQLCHPIILFFPSSFAFSTVEPQIGNNAMLLSRGQDWESLQNVWIPVPGHSLTTHNVLSHCYSLNRRP